MNTILNFRNLLISSAMVTAFGHPAFAQAGEYYTRYYDGSRECKSKENDAKLVGGLVGAVVGGVVGSQVSGHGARTEGSAIGAVVGGLAGAGIGDESVDCDKRYERATYSYPGNDYGYRPSYTSGYNHGYTQSGYNQGYSQPYTVTRPVTYVPASTSPVYRPVEYPSYGYSYENRNVEKLRETRSQLHDVKRRLRTLNGEADRLQRKLVRHNDRFTYRQYDEVCREIERLEKKRDRLQRRRHKLMAQVKY